MEVQWSSGSRRCYEADGASLGKIPGSYLRTGGPNFRKIYVHWIFPVAVCSVGSWETSECTKINFRPGLEFICSALNKGVNPPGASCSSATTRVKNHQALRKRINCSGAHLNHAGD